MVRGFGVGFVVTFDRDVHFIIRVHSDQTVKVEEKYFGITTRFGKKKIGKYKKKIRKFGAPTARHFCGGKWGRLTAQNKSRVS